MAINPARVILKPAKTVLLICDVQERLVKAILDCDKIIKNGVKLVTACNIMNIPIIVTEQNPKGLGKTVQDFDISCAKGPFSKTQFTAYTPEVAKVIKIMCNGCNPEAVVILGLETHICVEQTAIDLRKEGYEVHPVADCLGSRTIEDRLLGLQRMRDIGCHISTSENIIFKLMGSSDHKDFKKLSNLIKSPTLYTGLVPTPKL